MTADWDARTYDRVADPQTRWGATVLDRLPLRGDERVLDAGCGSGRVTELILERLPTGHVVALDGSAAMIDEARRRLAGAEAAGRVTFVTADLLDPLPIDPPVDAILSTATFHWITDHDRLFRNLSAAIRRGGRFVAQCGGAGNVATVLAAAESVPGYVPFEDPWLFATPEETSGRLRAAGFVEIETWLHPEPTPLAPGDELETFLATVVLREHLARLSEPDRGPYVHEVAIRLPRPEIDYVRLNIVATRAS